ncbi:MAG TPA: HAD-IIA family hydrolase [Solirubrobacterales bacterium]|nr:HAD-IIA family hydrolase [Solirubrobacterales bacterium]
MAIADSYDAFLCDLDGVVWLGHDFIPGAVETVNELVSSGRRICFVTNNPRLSPVRQAALLRESGITIEDRQVVTAASTLIRLAIERYGEGAPVLGVGTASFLEQLAEGGLNTLPPGDSGSARAVLVSGHRGFDYEELKVTSMLVRAGADLIATSADPTLPMPDGHWPGSGAILAAIETASGKKATITGKPAPALFEAGLDVLGRPERVAMIGDRVQTDIAGAQSCGIDGILVTSSPTSEAERAASNVTPEHEIESLPELVA